MSLYHRNSGLTWPQYLKSQSFADDIKQGIRRAGKAMSSKIDEQTDAIVDSNEELEQVFSSGLDQLDSTLQAGLDQANEALQNGFERMEYGLDKIAYGIAGLRSDFNWAMSGLLHKLDIQNLLLKDIYVELRIPDFQKERRYYVEQGCKHYTNGLYQESLESFLKAEPLEKTDPFVLYSIGQIYLYQPDMIDMDKAQDYFIRAGKYYVAEKKNKQAGQSYFHAGIAAYLRRDNVNAPQFAKQASELYPELLEAFYNHAKFLAVQGNDSGLSSLELAIRKDRNYALKVTADSDFACFSAQLQGLLNKLKREAKAEAEKAIANLEKELDEYVNFEETSKREIVDLLNLNKVRILFAKERYFDYLDCITTVQAIQKELKEALDNSGIAKELYTLAGHSDAASCVAFSPDSLLLASGSHDKTIKLWDVQTGKELHTIEERFVIDNIVFSPDGLILASNSMELYDKNVKLWDIKTGKILRTLTGHSESLSSIAFSPDGLILASASYDRTVRLWDLKTGRELYTLIGHSEGVNSIAFSPNGLLLASGSIDKTVKLWSVQTGKEILTLKGHRDVIFGVAFSPNGLNLASSSFYEVNLWDVQRGKELHTLKARTCQRSVLAISRDNLILASVDNNEVKLWDVITGKELYTLRGHSNNVTIVAFSPNSLFLASGSRNKIIIWNVKTGKELQTLTSHLFSFSSNGSMLATCSSEEPTIKLWSLVSEDQWKWQEEIRHKVEKSHRKAVVEHQESEVNQKHQREEEEAHRATEEHLHQQEQWRSEGRCEVCGEPIGFSFTRKTRCKKHR